MAEKQKCLAVVRVRGTGDASPDIERTLRILCLTRNCQITLLDDRPSYLGMLKKARRFVTWGEIAEENILALFRERGRIMGNKRIDDTYAKKVGYETLEKLAEAVFKLETEFRHLPGIKPVFRAHPPKKGYKGKVKKSYNVGGVIGYRGEAINKLVESMI